VGADEAKRRRRRKKNDDKKNDKNADREHAEKMLFLGVYVWNNWTNTAEVRVPLRHPKLSASHFFPDSRPGSKFHYNYKPFYVCHRYKLTD